jgi:hypothetical protein
VPAALTYVLVFPSGYSAATWTPPLGHDPTEGGSVKQGVK